MIFQDPYASLNPRMMVGDIIAEPLLVNGVPAAQRRRRGCANCSTSSACRPRRARAFRTPSAAASASASASRARWRSIPSLVVADEPVSALDVSVQAQIINLLLDLQDRLRLSMLFVAHDLGVVRHVSDRVAVMYVGRIVETAPTTALYARPRHPYTEALLAAVPKPDPALRDQTSAPSGEIADPANPPPGCAFHPRCPYAVERCRTELPPLREIAPAHLSACHRADELSLRGVA